ncbi:hypothetical protein E4T48_08552 [Aureobasidium sp. EXF-10727]|nr:hypothetical protein E4T48_08552 [Aureobasidium sp. EXF-10727]
MVPSEKSQPATEPYETEIKEIHETTWSSTSSSSTSLSSIHDEESIDEQNDHTIAFADLEPTASRSIPLPPQSHSDPRYEIRWDDNDVENPKNWLVDIPVRYGLREHDLGSAELSFLLMATVPETYGPALLRRRAEKKRKESGDSQWWSQHDEKRAFWPLLGASLWRPIYLTATEPILWFWDLYILIVYSMNYLTFVIYPRVFVGLRGWSTGHTGLSYLGIGVGNVLVIVCEPLLRKMIQRRKLDTNASAMAGNVLTRTIAGGTLPLAGPAIWNALGPHWQGTLLGLLEVLIIPIPFVFYKYGHLIRLRSKFISRMEQEARDPTAKPDAPTDIFSHSHTFSELVEDRQRQRQRKKSDKDALRRSQTSEAKEEESRADKRRRISDENGIELPTKPKPTDSERKTSAQASAGSESFAIAPTPQKPRPRQETVIELLDDSDDDEPASYNNASHDITPSNATSLEPTPAAEADPDADLDAVYYSDPEMREFARQAREKRRREERERAETGAHDPTVKLLITSPLPGTGPLIVSRKLSQNLQAVREAWLSKQSLDPSISSRIFFTFKLRKVYDVTTVRSLGIKVDSYGRIMTDGPFANTDDEHAEKIHIEVVTDEAWQQLKDDKVARDAPKQNKYLSHAAAAGGRGVSTEGTPAVEGEAAVEEHLIKVTLKAKGHSDIKIKVRPSTTFVKMINAARRSFKLDAERIVHLEFDGERLEPPEGLVKDTDISDMDCIDVHIK